MILPNIPILSTLIFLPFLGALFVILIDQSMSRVNARRVGLWVSGSTFFLAFCMGLIYGTTQSGFAFEERYLITADLGLEYHVALDALSLLFVLLSSFFFFLVMFASWNEDTKEPKFFVFLLLILETLVLGSLLSLNLLVFYIFFESVMVPVYFLSNIQKTTDSASKEGASAGIRNVLYTLIGSIFLLISILKVFDMTATFSYIEIIRHAVSERLQVFLCAGFLVSFLIKMPIFPFHTWLPFTYRTSHHSLAILLSAVITKLSFYGFIRFSVTLFNEGIVLLCPHLKWIFLVGFLYSLISMYGEKHMNRLFAHMDLFNTTLSLFLVVALIPYGLFVGLFHMVMTAITVPAVYYISSMLTNRLQTDRIKFFGGIISVMPRFSFVFFLGCYSLMPFPGSPFFASLVYIGGLLNKIYGSYSFIFIMIAAFIVSLAVIWLYRRMVFGVITEAMVRGLQDLSLKEITISGCVAMGLILLGLCPQPLSHLVNQASDKAKQDMLIQRVL